MWIDCQKAQSAYQTAYERDGNLRKRLQEAAISSGQIARICGRDYKTSKSPKPYARLIESSLLNFCRICSTNPKDLLVPESVARKALESITVTVNENDHKILIFFRMCFDRSAFRTPFLKEASRDDFIQAVEDTITAINTGALIHREDRQLLNKGHSRHELQSASYRAKMSDIERHLQEIRSRYRDLLVSNKISTFPYDGSYFTRSVDQTAGRIIDNIRIDIVSCLNLVFREVSIDELPLEPYEDYV